MTAKQKAQRIDDMAEREWRENERRAPDDAFNEAANLLTKRGAKKRAKARKIYKFWRACDTICCTKDKPR